MGNELPEYVVQNTETSVGRPQRFTPYCVYGEIVMGWHPHGQWVHESKLRELEKEVKQLRDFHKTISENYGRAVKNFHRDN